MDRVLLTGATGFVGQHVLRELLNREMQVQCIVRAGSSARLEEFDGSVQVVETEDLFAQSPDWWSQRCAGTDLVIHLAWYAEPGKYLTSDRNLDCLAGTLSLARGAARANVKRFVGAGTCFEYDLRGGELSVDTSLDPITPYAAAKTSAFLTLDQWLPLQGVSFLWARLFYLYGDGEDPRRLVPYLHQQMQRGEVADLTSGNQIRDFIEVTDAAKMLVDDAMGERTGASNISKGTGITVRALAESIADGYGRRDLLNFGARPDNLTDPPCVIGLRNIPSAT